MKHIIVARGEKKLRSLSHFTVALLRISVMPIYGYLCGHWYQRPVERSHPTKPSYRHTQTLIGCYHWCGGCGSSILSNNRNSVQLRHQNSGHLCSESIPNHPLQWWMLVALCNAAGMCEVLQRRRFTAAPLSLRVATIGCKNGTREPRKQ